MPNLLRLGRLAGFSALIAFTVFQAANRPVAAAAQPATRFYQGISTDQDKNVYTTWLGTKSGKTYGLVGFVKEVEKGVNRTYGARVYGTIKPNGKTSGSLYDYNNKKVGTYTGGISAGAGTGTFTEPQDGPTGSWDVEEVLPDAAAMKALNGNYTAGGAGLTLPDGLKVTVNLNKAKRTFVARGMYKVNGLGTFEVARISGTWIADADGHLWFLVLATQFNSFGTSFELPFKLPKQGFVMETGYEISGNTVSITNSLDGKDLTTLKRSR